VDRRLNGQTDKKKRFTDVAYSFTGISTVLAAPIAWCFGLLLLELQLQWHALAGDICSRGLQEMTVHCYGSSES
jgi:hypothetical protein